MAEITLEKIDAYVEFYHKCMNEAKESGGDLHEAHVESIIAAYIFVEKLEKQDVHCISDGEKDKLMRKIVEYVEIIDDLGVNNPFFKRNEGK